MILCSEFDSPIGKIVLGAREEALVGLWMEGQKYFGSGYEMMPGENAVLRQAKEWLQRYFAGLRPDPRELPLAPEGSEFRQAVWAALLEIPYGQTVSYGQILRRVGRGCAQAVGGAVGHNPISIIIPCHRVVGADGKMTGYAGGIEKKKFLLELEKRQAE